MCASKVMEIPSSMSSIYRVMRFRYSSPHRRDVRRWSMRSGLCRSKCGLGATLVCVVENEAEVRECRPNWDALLGIEGALCHITARGSGGFDCVSRSFAPKLGVREDPVCGSGHCHIVPLWAQKLGKTELVAYQASARGGVLYARNRGERVSLSGSAVLFSRNEISEENLQKWLWELNL